MVLLLKEVMVVKNGELMESFIVKMDLLLNGIMVIKLGRSTERE